MKKLRRLWVDDRALLREGRRVLRSLPSDLAVVAAVGEGGAAVEAARTRSPDIELMDLRLPGLGGVEATRRLKAAQPAAPVIVHTTSGKTKKSSPPCAPVPSATCSTPRPRQNWAQPSAAPPAARACGQSLAWTASTRRSFFSASPAVCLPSSSRRLPWAPAKPATGLAVGHDPRPRHARAARECRPALVHPPLLRLLRVRCLLQKKAPAGNPRGRWPEGLAPAATGLFAFFLIGYDLLAPQIDASVALLGIVFGILILRLVGQDVRRFCRLPRSRSGVFFT
jgi:CheY-like chemotaxis protein